MKVLLFILLTKIGYRIHHLSMITPTIAIECIIDSLKLSRERRELDETNIVKIKNGVFRVGVTRVSKIGNSKSLRGMGK